MGSRRKCEMLKSEHAQVARSELEGELPKSGQLVLPFRLTPFLCRGFLPRTPCWPGTVRRLPRAPPWSPGDDRWLPGTAGARGRCASVTLRRDSTDLRKFCSAGGQADRSPIKSFKIGKHWSQFVRSGSFAGSEVLTYRLRPEPSGFKQIRGLVGHP